MYSRKQFKKDAKHSLKEHFGIWVLVCVIGTFLAGEALFNNWIEYLFLDEASIEVSDENASVNVGASSQGLTDRYITIVDNILNGADDENKQYVDDNLNEDIESGESNYIFGRRKGVLSSLVNQVSSGSVFLTATLAVNSMLHSRTAGVIVTLAIIFLAYIAIWIFFMNFYKAISARMFLEGRKYEKIRLSRLLFMFRSGHWAKAAMTLFIKEVFLMLWNLTIVGGIIKHYSYYLVPYIVAENPNISPLEAITLSRKMMNGYKWDLFVLQLTFIGWEILGSITFGILNILFVHPYEEATYCEFYAFLRSESQANNIENSDKLNDIYLYETPSQEILDSTYAEIISKMNEAKENNQKYRLHGVKGFFARNFGITFGNSEEEKAYTENQALEQELYFENECYKTLTYPARLNPGYKIREKKPGFRERMGLNPLRSYSIWSIILIFFAVCFIGWAWEVSLHLVSDGIFVNRGVFHGPWLPIYGGGSVLILVLLYRFRKNLLLEFIATVVLCGFVEYFSALFLEISHGGMKWWDYTGYFMNLHGRICAEGLLVFGLGGIAIVYLLAPLLDSLFKKIKFQILIIICVVLLGLFGFDAVYSHFNPNAGKGITDYETSTGGQQN